MKNTFPQDKKTNALQEDEAETVKAALEPRCKASFNLQVKLPVAVRRQSRSHSATFQGRNKRHSKIFKFD